jgi:hypothetical protein
MMFKSSGGNPIALGGPAFALQLLNGFALRATLRLEHPFQRGHLVMMNLAARDGALPTNLEYDCLGHSAGTVSEGCELHASPSDTDVHLTLYAFSAFESRTLTCSFVDLISMENDRAITGVNSSSPGSTWCCQVSTNILTEEKASRSLEGENGNANPYLRYGQDPQIVSRDGCDSQSRKSFS